MTLNNNNNDSCAAAANAFGLHLRYCLRVQYFWGVIYDIHKDTGETKRNFSKKKNTHTRMDVLGLKTRNGAKGIRMQQSLKLCMHTHMKLWYG